MIIAGGWPHSRLGPVRSPAGESFLPEFGGILERIYLYSLQSFPVQIDLYNYGRSSLAMMVCHSNQAFLVHSEGYKAKLTIVDAELGVKKLNVTFF